MTVSLQLTNIVTILDAEMHIALPINGIVTTATAVSPAGTKHVLIIEPVAMVSPPVSVEALSAVGWLAAAPWGLRAFGEDGEKRMTIEVAEQRADRPQVLGSR